MTTRQRFHAVMNFQPFDRLPMIEWASWWDKTIERWRPEGLPASAATRYDLYRHFGLDVYYQNWVPASTKGLPKPAYHGAPLISSLAEYEKILPFLYPRPAIDRAQWQQWADEQRRGDAVLWFTVDGFFWFPRRLLGIEPHLYAFYDQPELMHRINTDLANWILQVVDEIRAVCTPDFMTFGEDMSYNHGPMLSKELFDEFLKPYYTRVLPTIKQHGTFAIIDSDGDVTVPSFWFEEAGLDGILPLERQAGVDIARLRAEHPRMRFIGHFDKMTMPHGESAMRTEFERLLPTLAQGGFIASVDHQTPPGVSLANYQVYLRLFREYADRAGKLSQDAAGRRAQAD
jgi:hypothetical protein